MEDVNVIVGTIKTLGVLLLSLTGISLTVVQYVKEKLGVDDKKAEIVSLVCSAVLAALVGWYWADSMKYVLELGQWIGVGLFVVIGTISPSGGYKLLGTFTRIRNQQ